MTALVIYIFNVKTPSSSDTVLRLYDSLAVLADSLETLNIKAEEQTEKIAEIETKQEETEKEFRIANDRWKKKEIVGRAEIQELIDTIPKLKEYISLRDSIDAFKQARIDSMNNEKRIQRTAYRDLIKINVAGIAVQDLILRNQREIIQEKDKELAREKRNRIWRTIRDIAIGAGAVYVVDRISELTE